MKFITALLLLTIGATSLTVSAQQTCAVTTDPFTGVAADINEFCVRLRCRITLPNTDITSFTGGFCNGDATLETNVDCDTLLYGYRAYYACLVNQGALATGAAAAEYTLYQNTPGVPMDATNFECYGCNNFRTVVQPSLGTTCDWSCATVAGQTSDRVSGYGHVLCGTGCITALMMIPFTGVTLALFLSCCLFIPSPSLKTTRARMEEDEERARSTMKADSDDEDVELQDTEIYEGRDGEHQPYGADDARKSGEEVHSRGAGAGEGKNDDDELREL